MEYNYNGWTGLQPNPNPTPLPNPYSQNPNPSSFTFNVVQNNDAATCSSEGAAATYMYYHDPNLGTVDPFRLTEVAAVSLNGGHNLTPANVNSNFMIQSLSSGTYKTAQRKSKVWPVRCELCKLEFNSNTVLNVHRLGRKHKRNLEKLLSASAAPAPSSVPVVASSVNPVIGPQEKPEKANSATAVEPVEDLETKRRKVLQQGAATDEVRICLACNVVCNSETVYKSHLLGKKHIANAKKTETSSTPASSASVVPSKVSGNTFNGPTKVNLGKGPVKENLATKAKKVLEGGAPTDEVRMCIICNVICNSEAVFNTHLIGKKHIANVRKHAPSGAGVAPAK